MHLLSKLILHLQPTTTWALIRSKYDPNASVSKFSPVQSGLSNLFHLFFSLYLISLSIRVIGSALLRHRTAVHRLSPTLVHLLSSDASLSLLLSGSDGSTAISLSFTLLPLYCLAIHAWILYRPLEEIWRHQYAIIITNADDFWASNSPQVTPLQLHAHLGPLVALQDVLKQIKTLWNLQTATFTTSMPHNPSVSVRTRIRALLLSWALAKVAEPALAILFGIALMTQYTVYVVPFAQQNSPFQGLIFALDFLLFFLSVFKTFQLVGILNHMGGVATYLGLATLKEQGRFLQKTVAWLRQARTSSSSSRESASSVHAHASPIPISFLSYRLAQYRVNQMTIHRSVLLYNDQLVAVFMLLTLLAIAPVSIAFSSMLLTGDLPGDKAGLAVFFQVTHIVAILVAVTMFNLICGILYSGESSLYTVQSFIKGHIGEKWRLLKHYEALNSVEKLAFTVGGFGKTINRRSFFYFSLQYYSFILYLSKLLIAQHSLASK